MRATEAFVVGAIAGAVVAWVWGRRIEAYVGEQTRGARTRAADGIRAVDEKAGELLDRGGDSLRRAEGFLLDTKAQVSDALRVGQNAIRPVPASADRGEPTA